jgi:hypothetical protein
VKYSSYKWNDNVIPSVYQVTKMNKFPFQTAVIVLLHNVDRDKHLNIADTLEFPEAINNTTSTWAHQGLMPSCPKFKSGSAVVLKI